jgi:FtsP/CotA-like multicopper oxidase with cupredoxin domain
MHHDTNLPRRQFLQTAGLTALAAAALPRWVFSAETGRFAREASPDFHPDVEIELTAVETTAPILPGAPTKIATYRGKLLKGPDGTVAHLPNTHLGAVISLQKGQNVRFHFKNDLSQPNIIHWHGLHVPQNMDGHPMYDVPAGSGYVYEFRIDNRAGMYMYHAHTHELTGHQVYQGLAGLIIISDSEERALNLPRGDYDLPIVLQDRSFDGDNQLSYVKSMRDRHMGFLGDEMIVNGKRHFVLPVATRPYRLRLLNGSNSRIYKLGWDDGTPLTVIGTDGGLLEKPLTRPFVMLAPGERLDIWADFSGRKVGSEMVMKSLPFSGAMPGHGDGGGRGAEGGMGMMGHGGEGGGHGGESGGRGGMMGMMGHGNEGGGHGGESGGHGGESGGRGGMMGMMGHGNEGGGRGGMMGHGGESGGHGGESGGMMGMMGHGNEGGGRGGMMGHGGEAGGPGGGEEEHGGMGMMGSSKLPQGGEYAVFKVHVMSEESVNLPLPSRLSNIDRLQRDHAENASSPRTIRISMQRMKWLLNGREFEMNAAAPEETVKVNSLQVIEFDNGYEQGGMGMGMMSGIPHPMHIHGQQFQVIERKVREDKRKEYETIHPGFVDDGWKDVVLVLPGEKVTLLKRFDDYKGLFLYHCHNLEHEEMGMMRNFNVV